MHITKLTLKLTFNLNTFYIYIHESHMVSWNMEVASLISILKQCILKNNDLVSQEDTV